MKKDMQLPEAQLAIMQIIWSHGGSMMFSELAEALEKKHRDWKANTVLTFLSRLADRGMLTVKKQGRLNEYVAAVSEKEYLEDQTRSFVEKMYGGDAKHLVSALFRQSYLSEEDYEELKDFWREGKM